MRSKPWNGWWHITPVAILGNSPQQTLTAAWYALLNELPEEQSLALDHVKVIGTAYYEKGKPYADSTVRAIKELEKSAGKRLTDGIYVIGNSPILELGMAYQLRKRDTSRKPERFGVVSVLYNYNGEQMPGGRGEGLELMTQYVLNPRHPRLKLATENYVEGQEKNLGRINAKGIPAAWKDCYVVDNHAQLLVLLQKALGVKRQEDMGAGIT